MEEGREIPGRLIITRTSSVPVSPETVVASPLSESSSAPERVKFKGVISQEQLRQKRIALVDELEARLNRGELPFIQKVPRIYLEGDKLWESQLTRIAAEKRVLTCVITSFQNALRYSGIYDPVNDSQEHLIGEVEDLFEAGGVNLTPALNRLVAARKERGLRVEVANFQDTIKEMMNGRVAIHGARGHMVFLSEIRSAPIDETSEKLRLMVRKVDPLAKVVHSKLVSLRELANEEPMYRVFYVERPSSRPRVILSKKSP